MELKYAIILGTRPEIIKLLSIIKYCKDNNKDYFIIHTNQHYSENMDKIFFEEFKLPKPKYNLNVGSENHGKQTGLMLQKIEDVLIIEKPTHIFIQGDTNSVLAGALAASKLKIKICHVEAGLRSYDRSMPEEINRIVADHISDYLFCPTEKQKKILLKEGINNKKIFVTGNTIVDAVLNVKKLINKKILKKYNLKEKGYILVTMHRPSNVDNKEILKKQMKNISRLGNENDLNIIFPIHARTLKNIRKFGIKIPKNINIVNPVGFIDIISLENFARIILTDSGGIQEEACILGIPCLILRENTERAECIEVGASFIVGKDYLKLKECFDFFNDRKIWVNPFGDGKSAEKIMRIIKNEKN